MGLWSVHAFGTRERVRHALKTATCHSQPEREHIEAAAAYMLSRIEQIPRSLPGILARAHGNTDAPGYAVHMEVSGWPSAESRE